MLAARVIPCLDVLDGRVVKGTNFVNLRDAGDPVEVARRSPFDTEVRPLAGLDRGPRRLLLAVVLVHLDPHLRVAVLGAQQDHRSTLGLVAALMGDLEDLVLLPLL